MHNKPFAESCVENREPILAVLLPRLTGCSHLLEIGSGTGQHAVYFAPEMPWLTWQTSDRAENHAGIEAWLAESTAGNVVSPLALDVLGDAWPEASYDAVFSANTAHIMSREAVAAMFAGVGRVLADDGIFLLYGPFCYGGRHTAPSNAEFDRWLKARGQDMGVRDRDWLAELAAGAGLAQAEDIAMPVNNRVLVWRRQAAGDR
jgi:cyclopropane fatty-acyl-phospholipid synthase-like methyltransferase